MRGMGVLKSSEFFHSSPVPWSERRRELGRKCGMGVSRSPSDLAHSRLYCSLVFTGTGARRDVWKGRINEFSHSISVPWSVW